LDNQSIGSLSSLESSSSLARVNTHTHTHIKKYIFEEYTKNNDYFFRTKRLLDDEDDIFILFFFYYSKKKKWRTRKWKTSRLNEIFIFVVFISHGKKQK
jgi:hypothetical protein